KGIVDDGLRLLDEVIERGSAAVMKQGPAIRSRSDQATLCDRDSIPPEMFRALNPFCRRMRVAK
ncbi:MAG: hypothetical protein H6Q98_742, partial [Nitrospirae bacterium]|nr:hypothetical protein [Nitrospirota bacterium]